MRFLLTLALVCVNTPEKDEPPRPPTAVAPETAHLGRAARELRPQADRPIRLRPSRPTPVGGQPRRSSRAQPAPPAPRDASRRQRLAEHAPWRGPPRTRGA